jgi:hypothetical protein
LIADVREGVILEKPSENEPTPSANSHKVRPEVADFIERVLVPALVKRYVRQIREGKRPSRSDSLTKIQPQQRTNKNRTTRKTPMKITLNDALSLLKKYVDERTAIRAVLVTPSLSAIRVVGAIRLSVIDDVPHLFVGEDDERSDQIKFRLSDCQFSYGDFRESKRASEDSVAHQFEGFLVVASSRGDTLSLFETKS